MTEVAEVLRRAGGAIARLDSLEREILLGYLHLMYHVAQPILYIPGRASRGARCKFCPSPCWPTIGDDA